MTRQNDGYLYQPQLPPREPSEDLQLHENLSLMQALLDWDDGDTPSAISYNGDW